MKATQHSPLTSECSVTMSGHSYLVSILKIHPALFLVQLPFPDPHHSSVNSTCLTYLSLTYKSTTPHFESPAQTTLNSRLRWNNYIFDIYSGTYNWHLKIKCPERRACYFLTLLHLRETSPSQQHNFPTS